jgi:hypothetical protein
MEKLVYDCLVDGRARFTDVREGRRAGFKGSLSRVESTRCRDTEGGVTSMFATRARWRVESNSSENTLDADERDGVGELGMALVGHINKDVSDRQSSFSEGSMQDVFEIGKPVGKPWDARALMTAFQPFSKVLILSRNSSFSFSFDFLSRSLSSAFRSVDGSTSDKPMPTRSCLFSSSSSATRRSR